MLAAKPFDGRDLARLIIHRSQLPGADDSTPLLARIPDWHHHQQHRCSLTGRPARRMGVRNRMDATTGLKRILLPNGTALTHRGQALRHQR